MGIIVKEKVILKKQGCLYVTRTNVNDPRYLDLIEVQAGRKKKVE